MKKGIILAAALLMLATVSGPACAFDLFGSSWPGSFLAPGCAAGPCNTCAPCRCHTTVGYVGWMDSNSAKIVFDSPASGDGGQKWPLRGVWLGLAERITVNPTWGLDFDVWALIPSKRQGHRTESLAETTVVRGFIGQIGRFPVVMTIPTNLFLDRTWETRPDWWYLDAAATYSMPLAFKALAGFRYEHFSTKFEDPSSVLGLMTTPDDTADATVNSYLPFVGVQYNTGGFSAKLIGFPIAPAKTTYGETGVLGVSTRVESRGNWSRGYFMEIFAEYSRDFSRGIGVGAFARWNWLHGQGGLATDVLPLLGGIGSPTVIFDRKVATVGGSLTLNFASPL